MLEAEILDYDLVRQVQEEMNEMEIWKGCCDLDYIGTSQHETATHVMPWTKTAQGIVDILRQQIRTFIQSNNVDGHTTVIFSASVEQNCEVLSSIQTPQELSAYLNREIASITEEDAKLPPSLLYATAAALEGCSFVNGASQNTLGCPALLKLYANSNYCLGTDFKAGQTKFKTAACEYLRTMGLLPKVIASANHLGNNDMHNLATSVKTRAAKLRVKHDIFAPWPEVAANVDHKVAVMYTPYINDEKRDYVEYTSLGFLQQPHTMTTYTRASDSILCVPLMIDAAVFCDYFSSRHISSDKVACALSYLFKVPEGGAMGVDPGFFAQMTQLERIVQQSSLITPSNTLSSTSSSSSEDTWEIPSSKSSVICSGLACVDMQLLSAAGRGQESEDIQHFAGESTMAGGSVSMCCKTLARLTNAKNESLLQKVIPLCRVGKDDTGSKLLSLLQRTGPNTETKYIQPVDGVRTALAVLPIYSDGRRGCFFDAASNVDFKPADILPQIRSTKDVGAMIFGYPHLLPQMQGENLAELFQSTSEDTIVVLDLNGVPPPSDDVTSKTLKSTEELKRDTVLGPVLPYVDILHCNEEELKHLTGSSSDNVSIEEAASLFLNCGVAMVAVTLGSKGCIIVTTSDESRFEKSNLPSSWINQTVKVPATTLASDTEINSNGAGDSFTSGLVVASLLRKTATSESLTLEDSAKLASTIASRHVDMSTRDMTQIDIQTLLES